MPGEENPDAPKDPNSEVFGDVIFSYTKEEAIEDGILFSAGRLLNRDIVLTTNLIASLEKAALLTALVTGLAKAKAFQRPDLAIYYVAETKIYVDDNGETITIMLPEDY